MQVTVKDQRRGRRFKTALFTQELHTENMDTCMRMDKSTGSKQFLSLLEIPLVFLVP